MSDLDEKRFCVYVHRDKDGIIRYVGSGTLDRAKRTNHKSNKSREYSDYVLQHGQMNSEVLYSYLTKPQALEIEQKLYNLHISTIFNKYPPASQHEMSKDLFDKYLYYDETSETGLRWKVSKYGRGYRFRKVGEPAGCLNKANGYYITTLNGVKYRNHRIILVLHGIDVDNLVVDHIDRNSMNNKLSNLRAVTQQVNMRNRKQPYNLESKIVGIICHPSGSGWVARWYENRKPCSKYFSAIEYETMEAAKEAAIIHRNKMVELHYKQ